MRNVSGVVLAAAGGGCIAAVHSIDAALAVLGALLLLGSVLLVIDWDAR